MAADTRIVEILQGARRPLLSVEFFPPGTDEAGKTLLETAAVLRDRFRPAFVSITYGAGGTTRERTWRYAKALREEFGFLVMPHLTCVGSSRDEIVETVRGYHEAGFRNLMALRGDPPKGSTTFTPHPDGCRYASDLVGLLHDRFPDICLGVGGYPETHPEASSPDADLAHLRKKVHAGAGFITTQLFFDNAPFLAFRERCKQVGITCPIVPGLLPALSLQQVEKFCALGGATLPPALASRLAAAGADAEAVREVGVQWAFEQAVGLIEAGVPALHLYILNRSASALRLLDLLKARGLV